MQFKANCQRLDEDYVVVESIGLDETYLSVSGGRHAAVILSKEDALALASTIINHYKVEQK